MSFDFKRVRTGELIAAAGAVVLFISMFLKWFALGGSKVALYLYLVGGHPHPLTGTAWHAFSNTAILLLLLVVLALAMGGVTATAQRVQFPLAGACAALGVLSAALLLYRLFGHRPGGNTYTTTAFGAYLGLIATIAILVGAVIVAREDGVRMGSAGAASGTDPAPGGGLRGPEAPPPDPS